MPPRFSDRTEVVGTFGVAATSHYIASQVAMRTLERGGNAFDAAAAAAFTLQVVEPHQLSLGGEAVILLEPHDAPAPRVICGQGVGPRAATIDAFRAAGLTEVPGTDLLAAAVPGGFDAWLLLVRDYGTVALEDLLAPAIHYAAGGFPVTAEIILAIRLVERGLRDAWPSSADVYLANGRKPAEGSLLRNPVLAETYRRLLREAKTAGSDRVRQIEAARAAFYRGFVADEVDRYVRHGPPDGAGAGSPRGWLAAEDFAGWEATYEEPVSCEYRDTRVFKAGPWSQGPVVLETLCLLREYDVPDMDPFGDQFVHTLTEAKKLAYADREAWYGDPAFTDVPIATLLSDDYTNARRKLMTETASLELRPGAPDGREPRLPDYRVGESPGSGDTCHIDVIDRWGNVVAATPSGGWLHGSPIIPSLGFPLNTRVQMSWLQEGLASSLVPGKRPRTTLSPTIVHRRGAPYLACGAQSSDFQDQWTLQFLLRHLDAGLDLQTAVDAPMFYSEHCPSSKSPRAAFPGRLTLDRRFPEETLERLRKRGHLVQVKGDSRWGRNCAAAIDGHALRASASAAVPQSRAIGR